MPDTENKRVRRTTEERIADIDNKIEKLSNQIQAIEGAYPEFCVTAKMRCKIELIFQGGSGVGCARLVYNITPTGAEVKGRPRSLEPRRRRSAP